MPVGAGSCSFSDRWDNGWRPVTQRQPQDRRRGPVQRWGVATRDVEFVRRGMPTYGLFVWLTDRREQELARQAEWRGPGAPKLAHARRAGELEDEGGGGRLREN